MSNNMIRAEDLDRRVMILNKWWTGLLEMLNGRNNQSISGTDRPAFLDAVTGIMMRPEWRMPYVHLSTRQSLTQIRSSPLCLCPTPLGNARGSSTFMLWLLHKALAPIDGWKRVSVGMILPPLSLSCPLLQLSNADNSAVQTLPFGDPARYAPAEASYTKVTFDEFTSFERFHLPDRVDSSQREKRVCAEPPISNGLCCRAHVNEECASQLGHFLWESMVSTYLLLSNGASTRYHRR